MNHDKPQRPTEEEVRRLREALARQMYEALRFDVDLANRFAWFERTGEWPS